MNTFNQTSQSAVYREDDISVSLTVCGGSYGGGSEVLILQRRFSTVTIADADVSPTLEAGAGGGGNNLPIVLESNQNHARAFETEICPALPASMGMGGGYVPMIVASAGFCPAESARTNGIGFQAETAPSLTGGAIPAVMITKAAMTYQKTAGTLNPGAHPGSYNGQDAYNDMLVTDDGMGNGNRTGKCRNHEGGVPNHEHNA